MDRASLIRSHVAEILELREHLQPSLRTSSFADELRQLDERSLRQRRLDGLLRDLGAHLLDAAGDADFQLSTQALQTALANGPRRASSATKAVATATARVEHGSDVPSNLRPLTSSVWQKPTPAPPSIDWPQTVAILREAIEVLGKTPLALDDTPAVSDELDRLARAIAPQQLKDWASAGTLINRALSSWVVTRARAVQDMTEQHRMGDCAQRLATLFPLLSGHSKATQPGAIYGLARAHQANYPGGWLGRARTCEDKVRELASQPDLEAATSSQSRRSETRPILADAATTTVVPPPQNDEASPDASE